jgi:hypothetical protein
VPVLATGLDAGEVDQVAEVGPTDVTFAGGRQLALTLDTSRPPAAVHFAVGPLLPPGGG